MIKRYLAGIALLTVITMSGCSAKVQETTAEAGTTPAAEAAADSGAASDVIEIEFWHALENQYEETLNRVVGDFNSTHDSICLLYTSYTDSYPVPYHARMQYFP